MKGVPLGGALFALVYFRVFHFIVVAHLTCVFPSLADDTHIIGLASYMLLAFLQL